MIDTSLSKLPLHQHINEPELVFAGGNVSNHPLRGLCKYGPYSLDLKYLSQISIATLKTFPLLLVVVKYLMLMVQALNLLPMIQKNLKLVKQIKTHI